MSVNEDKLDLASFNEVCEAFLSIGNLQKYAADNGCSYLTFNVPNSECRDCGFIAKVPLEKCPKCGSDHIDMYDRIIGYLTKIKNWSSGRQEEFETRVFGDKGKYQLYKAK